MHHNSEGEGYKNRNKQVPFSESSPLGKAGLQCTGHGYTTAGWQNEFLRIVLGSCPRGTWRKENPTWFSTGKVWGRSYGRQMLYPTHFNEVICGVRRKRKKKFITLNIITSIQKLKQYVTKQILSKNRLRISASLGLP